MHCVYRYFSDALLSPLYDDETHKSVFVSVIVFITILMNLAHILSILFFTPSTAQQGLHINIIFLILQVFLIWLVQLRYTDLVSALLLILGWIFITWSLVVGNGIGSHNFFFYSILLVLAGLLFDIYAVMAMALLIAISGLLMAIYVPYPASLNAQFTPLQILAHRMVELGTFVVIYSIVLLSFRRAIGQARQNANTLMEYNNQLEAEIMRRRAVEHALLDNQRLLTEIGRIAKIGAWEFDFINNQMRWNKEVFHIHDLAANQEAPLLDSTFAHYDETGQDFLRAAFTRALQDGVPWDMELPFTTAKGQRLWVRMLGYPFSEKGVTTKLIGAIQDITQLKAAQDALRESDIRYRTLAQNFPDGVVILYDHDLRCVLIDGQGLEKFDLQGERSQSRPIQETLPPDFYEPILSFCRSALKGEHVVEEITFRGRVFINYFLPLYDADGAVKYGMLVTQDITERKAAEAQRLSLALAQQRADFLTEFLEKMSHDFKTPLSIINTNLALLQRLDSQQNRAERIQKIEAQTKRLNRYLEDILRVARLEYLPSLNLSSVNLNDLLDTLLSQFQSRADEKQIRLVAELSSGLPIIEADAEELAHALMNLIENAITYTPEGGSVVAQTMLIEGAIQLSIRDTGIGISAEDLPHIYERFYRSEQARRFNQAGTGLGLAIVKRIIDMHGYQLMITSTPGQGTAVQILLPLSQHTDDSPQLTK